MSKIFVSYRRKDSRIFTERIHDRLVQVFGTERVFLDVDNLPRQAGSNFPDMLMEILTEATVTLIMIDDQWLDIREDGDPKKRRLDNPDDFVRIEVETALNREAMTTIPVLLRDTDMPPRHELPETIHDLANLQSSRVRLNPDFHRDMSALIRVIHGQIEKNKKLLAEKMLAEGRSNTEQLLEMLNISQATLEANREKTITDDQKKAVLPKPVSGVETPLWSNVMAGILAVIFMGGIYALVWYAATLVINPTLLTGLNVICGTGLAGLALVGLALIFENNQEKPEPTLKVLSVTSQLSDVYDNNKRIYFEVGTQRFSIADSSEKLRFLRQNQGRTLTVYYTEHDKAAHVLSMAFGEPPAQQADDDENSDNPPEATTLAPATT